MNNETIVYREHSIQDVVDYFVEGFDPIEGKEIYHYDWWYDSQKGKIMLRLSMRPLQ